MIEFIKKIVVFLLLFCGLALVVPMLGSYIVQKRNFNNGNSESNLLVLSDKKEFDLLILGNSHARNFSRYNQHEALEKELNSKVLNMGQGRGICGVNDQLFYFKYLLKSGYKFKQLIYTVSSPHLYGNHLDSITTTFFEEPLSLSFVSQYIFHPAPNKKSRLLHYIKTKWKPSWVFLKPNKAQNNLNFLNKMDSLVVEKGFELAFPNGLREPNFIQSVSYLEEIISLAREKGIKVTLLETPILFEKWPGQKRLKEYCRALDKKGLVNYIDLKQAVTEPKYFYDHHHLNTAGIQKLLPILKEQLKVN